MFSRQNVIPGEISRTPTRRLAALKFSTGRRELSVNFSNFPCAVAAIGAFSNHQCARTVRRWNDSKCRAAAGKFSGWSRRVRNATLENWRGGWVAAFREAVTIQFQFRRARIFSLNGFYGGDDVSPSAMIVDKLVQPLPQIVRARIGLKPGMFVCVRFSGIENAARFELRAKLHRIRAVERSGKILAHSADTEFGSWR